MKKLKVFLFTVILLTLVYSCTDNDDDDYQTNTVESTLSTGGDNTNTGDGGKD